MAKERQFFSFTLQFTRFETCRGPLHAITPHLLFALYCLLSNKGKNDKEYLKIAHTEGAGYKRSCAQSRNPEHLVAEWEE